MKVSQLTAQCESLETQLKIAKRRSLNKERQPPIKERLGLYDAASELGYTSVFALGTEYQKEILYEATQMEGSLKKLRPFDRACISHAFTRYALKFGIDIYDPPGDGNCLYTALAFASLGDPTQ